MQVMRLKFGERRRNDWTCCFCCHVRTGTIFLGIWHLRKKPELLIQDGACVIVATLVKQQNVCFLGTKGNSSIEILGMYSDVCLEHSSVSSWCTFFQEGRVNLADQHVPVNQ
uniref:(California timema) hypothetical protein n=1 Tax=Timema californicum TaxID=61474 RepID=A0A7R9JCH3_TIMCA|nr:unnamed protein product [Timema californicum]